MLKKVEKLGFLFVFGLLVAAVSGCIVRNSPPVPWTPSDAGPIVFSDVEIHPCDMEDDGTDSDFFNCGMCDNVCDSVVTDRCVFGTCMCGLEDSCGPTEECRFNSCHESDPLGEVCEFDDECAAGYACLRGHCSFVRCVPEVCDSVDNDCDGVIDGTVDSPISRWCWDDFTPASTSELFPPCERGVQVCNMGLWEECVGGVQPIPEVGLLACDGEDNDCDGCVDGYLTSSGECAEHLVSGYDVVFAIDVSGSMLGAINAVRDAVDMFSELYRSDPGFKFGIVLFPSETRDGYPEVFLPLSPFAVFETALAMVTTTGGGDEPSYDAVTMLGTGDLAIGWRRNTIRIIILFSDEYAQSYSSPRNTETTMCESLTHGEVLAVFENPSFFDDFDQCGMVFALRRDPLTMVDDLSGIISDPCTSTETGMSSAP